MFSAGVARPDRSGFNLLPLVPGISRLEPTVVSLLGFLSPGTAVLLGMVVLGSDAECASNHRRPARDREYLAGPTFQPHSLGRV